jgi:glucan 1,3-beta-glucosidase
MISVAGNLGLSIQAIVADPTSAPMEILGAITGGTGVRTEEDFARVGGARRGISTDDLKKISNSFADTDAKFQSIIKHECHL